MSVYIKPTARLRSALRIAVFITLGGSVHSASLAQNVTQAKTTIAQGSVYPMAIPYEIVAGHLVVKVTIGTAPPSSAILATGLATSVINPDIAVKMGLKAEGMADLGILDRIVRVSKLPAQSLRFEKFGVQGAPFVTSDMLTILSSHTDIPIPPIWLGASAFDALSVTVDPINWQIVMRPSGIMIPGKAYRIPFIVRDGRCFVQMKVNDSESFDALIDTTNLVTLIPSAIVKKLNLTSTVENEVQDNAGKIAKVGLVNLTKLSAGKAGVDMIAAAYVSDPGKSAYSNDFGMIGLDFLMRFRFTIDMMKRDLYLEPLPEPKPVTPPPAKVDPKKPVKPAANQPTKPGGG